MDRTIARPLFAGLCHALRETDVIGWYRDERTAGAVLTPCGDESCAEVARDVTQRVSTVLGEALPARVASRLLVRVFEFHPTLTKSIPSALIPVPRRIIMADRAGAARHRVNGLPTRLAVDSAVQPSTRSSSASASPRRPTRHGQSAVRAHFGRRAKARGSIGSAAGGDGTCRTRPADRGRRRNTRRAAIRRPSLASFTARTSLDDGSAESDRRHPARSPRARRQLEQRVRQQLCRRLSPDTAAQFSSGSRCIPVHGRNSQPQSRRLVSSGRRLASRAHEPL